MQLNAVRTLTVRGQSQGLDRVKAQLDGVSAAQEGVARSAEGMAKATETSARRQLSAANAFERLMEKNDRMLYLQRQLEREMAIVNRAYEQGAISTTRHAQATELLQSKFQKLAAAEAAARSEIQGTTAAINAQTGAVTRLNAANDNTQGFNTANVAAQFQDIGVTAAMGQSPLTIALQQGTQLSAVLGTQGLTGVVRTLGAAFASILSPVSLITIGVVALAAAGIQALFGIGKEAEKATDRLEKHSEWLDQILKGYRAARDAAAAAAEQANKLPQASVEANLVAQREKAMQDEIAAFEAMIEKQAQLRERIGTLTLGGDTFSALIDGLQPMADMALNIQATTAQLDDFHAALTRIINSHVDDETRAWAQGLLDYVDQARAARVETDSLGAAINRLPRDVQIRIAMQQEFSGAMEEMSALFMDPRSRFEIAREQLKNWADQATATAQTYSQLVGVGERYEKVLASINAAEAEANKKSSSRGSRESEVEQQRKAYDSLIGSIEERIARAEMEVEALGLSEEAAARLRAEFEILQQYRQAGVTPDPGEVDGYVDRLMAAEGASKKLTQATDEQKRAMDQLADAAKTAIGGIMDLMGIGDSPIGKGINAALTPLLKGDWIGALIAGVTGLFMGFVEAEKKAREAREALAKASFDIESFLKESVGESFTEAEKAMNAFTKRGEEFIKLAQAAGDHTLVARIQQAIAAYAQTVAAAEAAAAKQTAIDAATDRVAQARAALTNAYQREASRLDQVIDRWKQLSAQLRDFVSNMRLSAASPLSIYDRMGEARRQFEEVAAKALGGDQDAIAKLTGVSQAYLDEAKAYYASSTEYLSIFEDVERTLNQALAKTDTQVSIEEQQRNLLDESVRGLGVINSSVVSVEFAIRALQAALANQQAVGGFDQATYWSPTLKNFYSELQNYKSATGATSIPDEIMGVWNAFAGATSGQQYDQLAAGYTNTLRDLMKGLGIPGYANGTMFHPGGLALVGEREPELVNLPRGSQVFPLSSMGPANDNALIQRVDRLSAQVERLISAAERGTEAVAGAVHGVRGEVARGNGRSELASLQRPPARRTGTNG